MASNSSHRPSPLRSTRSFPRPEPSAALIDTTRPKRASTLQNGASPSQRSGSKTQVKEDVDHFESRISEEAAEPPRQSVDLDELPIELISFTDRFIEQLSAKVHPTPPNIDNLSNMFQEFYATAASHIQTHIDSLATRQRREASPAPSSSSRQSAASLLRAKAASLGNKEKAKAGPVRRDSDQQMLTAEEYADRRKARKALEQKRVLMEEAVERRLCEGIHNKIYRHHTTQDEAQDDKLKSKTAALSVVGIGPSDLGIDIGGSDDPESAAKKQEEVKAWLEEARKELILMNESRYPLGKLNHLKAAHKSIIDTLAHFHPSSSADELMPMLIYTLITLPPANLNVISDVNFIQRFRWEPKLVGETAYCLTNLEAAISFLETVDLSTLRADEAPTGPLKSVPGTPRAETFPPAYSAATPGQPETTSVAGTTPKTTSPSSAAGLRAAVQLRNRRLSDLVNTPAQAFNAASDAVLLTADQGLKTIGTSLGESYKFLLGKLREQPEGQGSEIIVPKTLDDARKLIGTPPPNDDDDAGSASGTSSVHSPEDGDGTVRRTATPREDKLLNLVAGGRKASRDRSVDSAKSGSSGKRAVSGGVGEEKASAGSASSLPAGPASALDSMRNLGSSLNPMARFSAGLGGLRGFGRTSSTPAVVPSTGGDLATAFPDLAAALPPKEVPKVDPPIKRFMELQNPADLRLGEVLELLRDYRRLANALKDMGALKE
ncbi:hypothetical protein QBC34DRAFT_388201 [Podospora aff. communis PSN243]|uniref:VPS9 domain-containing protein n=1 Tax=Podospora aff. communis PSN243 TaxID=3040156 RepID=A0AAV9H7K9_9PEZI|nr:hypothetical protein QBC34DRAFT_388201 [Podospora aff. communis PSN243]